MFFLAVRRTKYARRQAAPLPAAHRRAPARVGQIECGRAIADAPGRAEPRENAGGRAMRPAERLAVRPERAARLIRALPRIELAIRPVIRQRRVELLDIAVGGIRIEKIPQSVRV